MCTSLTSAARFGSSLHRARAAATFTASLGGVKPGVGSAGLTLRRLRVSVGTGEVERERELLPEPAAGVGTPTSSAARLLQVA
jgi:hypothetical protein